MTPLYLLTELSRQLIALWAFLLCTFGILTTVYAACQKRSVTAVLAFVLLLASYLQWQILINLNKTIESTTPFCRACLRLPWIFWILSLTAVALAMTLLLAGSVRYKRMYITPGAIQTCADQMSSGICYWRDSGRVIFSNPGMKRLCIAMTGRPLLNGLKFYEALPEGYLTVDGRTWSFACCDLILAGEPLHEIIATDVTEEHSKTEMLRRDTEELLRINRELQEHRLMIQDTVRKQEILQAKVNIHDEMNRLMMSTVVADRENRTELRSIFSLWKRNALLLCREAESDKTKMEKIRKMADQIGIRLVCQDEIPKVLSDQQRNLFFSALREVIINAAKHAGAETVTVSFVETEESVSCFFENDGKIPSDSVRFTGGLLNLSLMAKEQNATVSAKADQTFLLTIILPRSRQ